MTTPVLAPAAPEPAPTTQLIPAADLLIGHVIADPEGSRAFRVMRLFGVRGPLGADLAPNYRAATGTDIRHLIGINHGDHVRVLPAREYTVELFATRSPHAPTEVVRIAAETEATALMVATWLVWSDDYGWANVIRADGTDLDVVTAVA